MVVAHPQYRRSSSFIGTMPPTRPKVHCPKADRNVEKQHHMMNRRAESVVGGTVGAHAKAHHHEAGTAHDEQTKCSTANTEPATILSGRYMLIRPAPQHDTWPGKPSTALVCCTCQYTDHNITSSLLFHGTPPTPDADPTAPPHGTYILRERTHGPVTGETCVVAVVATW